jgi:transposase
MSNRFDPMHKLASKQDAAIDALAGVRNDVVTGGGRRRRWSSVDKARIVRESLKPGAVVSEVAQRHGLTRWQLYDWRRKVRTATGGSAVPDDQAKSSRPNTPSVLLTTFCPSLLTVRVILTAADNRLGSMARKTVNLSEWALIKQQPQAPSKLKVAGSIP